MKTIFAELLKPRTIFTGLFFVPMAILCYKVGLETKAVPDALNTIVSSMLGYWFGLKSAEILKKGKEDENS